MHYSFLFKNPEALQVARDYLNEDVRAARLSRVFRTYYRLRPLIPIAFRQVLQRRRKVEVSQRWYVPDAYLSSLAKSIRTDLGGLRIVHPWPHGARFAFVLTHDVETIDGVRNVEKVAQVEEDLGFRSSWNFVPFKYPVDPGLLRDLQSRSFEIGIHGYNHDGRLYASRNTFQHRSKAINSALAQFRAVGFRSPMVHRNLEWLQLLDIEYDSSYFDIDPFQPMPGGIGSIWPFVAGRFVELPYTLPQDHTLFIALGKQDCGVWRDKLDVIVGHHGMALMLTHPDYLVTQRHLDLYREFLIDVRTRGGYWHAIPKHVARWWRQRDQMTADQTSDGRWTIRGPAREKGSLATIQVNDGELVIRRAA